MSEISRSPLPPEVASFLKCKGVSLRDEGSAERGLHLKDATEFLVLLEAVGARVLGLEPWRMRENRYRIDSLAAWAAETADSARDFQEARKCLLQFELGAEDVVTIQF